MELAVSTFSGELQKKVLDKMNLEYFSSGKFVKGQMSVSPKIWSSLVLSGNLAGMAASTALSDTLFMATAPVASLMKLGSGGFSTAVMSTNGR